MLPTITRSGGGGIIVRQICLVLLIYSAVIQMLVTIADILHASALGSHFMILNSFKDAEELFEKRASKYSDRPTAPVIPL